MNRNPDDVLFRQMLVLVIAFTLFALAGALVWQELETAAQSVQATLTAVAR